MGGWGGHSLLKICNGVSACFDPFEPCRMVLWPNGLAGPAGDLPAYSALSALGVEAMKYKEVLGN